MPLDHFLILSQLLANFLSFWHTFSSFGTLFQHLAHFSYFLSFQHNFSAFSTISQLSVQFLSFQHTFSAFWHSFSTLSTLSKLLAQFIILSLESQLMACILIFDTHCNTFSTFVTLSYFLNFMILSWHLASFLTLSQLLAQFLIAFVIS